MTKIDIELNDQIIIKKGVGSIIDFYKTIAKDQFEMPGLSIFITGVNSPFLNVVIDTRTEQTINKEQMKIIKNFFDRYQVPWVWLLTPIAKLNDLELNGLDLLEEAPGMYFDLSKSLPAIQTNFKIEEADENNDLATWIEPLNEGFPGDDSGVCYRKLNADLLNKSEKKLRHFIAYFDNEVAAAATLFLSEDSVMLHNLATKHKFKKRGLGKALALHRMKIAKNLGYKHCFLDASEEGYQLHRKLGLKVYCITKAYQLKIK